MKALNSTSNLLNLYSLPHCAIATLPALPPPTPHRCLRHSQKVPVEWQAQAGYLKVSDSKGKAKHKKG